MQCKPHSNGNVPQDFRKAGRAISEAATAFNDAINAALSEVTNGRNYQHMPANEQMAARSEDLRRISIMRQGAKEAIDVGLELFRAGEKKL